VRHRWLRAWPPAAVVCAVLLVTTACGGSAGNAPAGTAPAGTGPRHASVAASSAASSSAAPTRVTIAVPAVDVSFAYVYLARDMGFLKKYGIHVQIEAMKIPTAIAAVQSGKIAFMTVVGSSVNAALRGLPLKILFVSKNHPPYLLVGAKGLSSVSQLRGKVVAGNVTPTDTVTVSTETLLKAEGLPAGSYKLLLLGTNSPVAHLAALTRGEIDATMLDPAFGFKAKAEGYPILAHYWPTVTWATDGLITTQSYLQQHTTLVDHMLAALVQAMHVINQDPSRALPYMEKDFHLSPAEASQLFSTLKDVWTKDGIPSAAALQGEMKVEQISLKLKTEPKPTMFDLGPLQQVLKQIGKPGLGGG
jgi:ABC-type nitrate/sulfonate/bicarbonate transport system substrate-binding protein